MDFKISEVQDHRVYAKKPYKHHRPRESDRVRLRKVVTTPHLYRAPWHLLATNSEGLWLAFGGYRNVL